MFDLSRALEGLHYHNFFVEKVLGRVITNFFNLIFIFFTFLHLLFGSSIGPTCCVLDLLHNVNIPTCMVNCS